MLKLAFGKFAVVAAFFAVSASAFAAQEQSFMPENDLWKEDNREIVSAVSQLQFDAIIDAAEKAYAGTANSAHETIVVNRRWDDSTVNANVGRNIATGTVNINMYGGLARRPEIIPEAFALVICHELGHAYGGLPYVSAPHRLAAEGIADYYGAGECMRRVIPGSPSGFMLENASPLVVSKCATVHSNTSQEFNVCVRTLEGALSVTKLLATLMHEAEPSLTTPDARVVEVTELSYPKTVQCRLDTYHNGAFNLEKPLCWYKPATVIP